MQEHDARLLRGAAIPTVVVGVIAAAVAAVVTGGSGLLGSVVGALLVLAFFSVSFFAIGWAGKRRPGLMFPVALLTYTTKIVVFGVLIGLLKDVPVLHPEAFAVTVGACLTVWVGGLLIAARNDRRPLEPVPSVPGDEPQPEESRGGSG